MCPQQFLRKVCPIAIVTCVTAFALCVDAAAVLGASEQATPLAKWIPADAVAVVVAPRPAELLQKLENDPAIRAMLSSRRLADRIEANRQLRQVQAVVSLLEGQLQSDWKTILKNVTAGGVVLAVMPNERFALIAESKDPEALRQVNDFVLNLTRLDPANRDKQEAVREAEYRGVRAWSLSRDASYALIGGRLVICNRAELLRQIIDLTQDGGEAVADLPWYQEAVASLPPGDLAMILDFRALRGLPNVSAGLEQAKSPLPVLLSAGLLEMLSKTDWLGLTLAYEAQGVKFALRSGGEAGISDAFSFAVPSTPSEGALPNIEVPGRVAALSVYRNLHDYYVRKNELFPERTSSLIFFENMMGIFFTGRNFTEEVLSELDPHVRVVVAHQQFTPETGTPEVHIPAFALVFRMKNPERFGPIVEEGWQKALGLINFVRGQDAQPGLILDRLEYRGVKYTVSYFSTADEDLSQPLPMRFNFRPVVIVQGENLILASAESLGRSIMDALDAARSQQPVAGSTLLMEADLSAVSELIDANREALIRQNMLGKGSDRESATKSWEQLKRAVELFRKSEVVVELENGRPAVDAKIDMNLSVLEQLLPAE